MVVRSETESETSKVPEETKQQLRDMIKEILGDINKEHMKTIKDMMQK